MHACEFVIGNPLIKQKWLVKIKSMILKQFATDTGLIIINIAYLYFHPGFRV